MMDLTEGAWSIRSDHFRSEVGGKQAYGIFNSFEACLVRQHKEALRLPKRYFT